MKKYIALASVILTGFTAEAQIRFYPHTPGNNDLGIVYSLPTTMIRVDVEAIKVSEKAGPYYLYADKYLGIKDPVKENREYYQMGKVEVSTEGFADKSMSYLIEVGPKSEAPNIELTSKGVLQALSFQKEASTSKSSGKDSKDGVATKKNKFERGNISSEDMLMAGSTGKMAELTAQQIYRLRESRTGIMTGETENVPKDGEGLKLMLETLDNEEHKLVEQFSGTRDKESNIVTLYFEPGDDVVKDILFRFSSIYGVVAKEDLSGAPIYISLKGVRTELPKLDPKEQKRLEKEEREGKVGLIYNIPGEAKVEVFNSKTETLAKGKFSIAQYGEYKALPLELFNPGKNQSIRTAIEFYPETGGIKTITK